MGERPDSPPEDDRDDQRDPEAGDTTARRILLQEARTTTNQQLTRIDKIDAQAVRTVRITFLLLSLLLGASQLPPFPDLGVFGLFGTWLLLISLFSGLFVYGTSQLFVGSSLDQFTGDVENSFDVDLARDELIREYEGGMQPNRKILHLNGFVLATAISLLALSVAFVVFGWLGTRPKQPVSFQWCKRLLVDKD